MHSVIFNQTNTISTLLGDTICANMTVGTRFSKYLVTMGILSGLATLGMSTPDQLIVI